MSVDSLYVSKKVNRYKQKLGNADKIYDPSFINCPIHRCYWKSKLILPQ